MEIAEVQLGEEGDVQEFEVEYTSGRKLPIVNVYNPLRQVGGERSQDRSAQTTSWRQPIGQENILVEGDWNVKVTDGTSGANQSQGGTCTENVIDEYKFVDV